jgi:hypothetical protein
LFFVWRRINPHSAVVTTALRLIGIIGRRRRKNPGPAAPALDPRRGLNKGEKPMAAAPGRQELRDNFFRALVDTVLPLQPGQDPEVTLEALIDAAQMLVEHLQQELAELRTEQAE